MFGIISYSTVLAFTGREAKLKVTSLKILEHSIFRWTRGGKLFNEVFTGESNKLAFDYYQR